MSDNHHKLIILGSGPAGYTAAVYGSRALLEPILLQGIQPGGQLTITTEVENWPGVKEIQDPDLMTNLESHAKSAGTKIINETIIKLNLKKYPFIAMSEGGNQYEAESIILATGAQAKWLGLKSEEKYKGFGVSACATCDGFFFRNEIITVIGGGNTAVEEALFLTNFARKVILIHRRDNLRAEKILQERLFKNPKVEVIWNSQLKEIIGIDNPLSVEGIKIENLLDKKAKNVIVLIGDGMGINQITAYKIAKGGPNYSTAFDRFPFSGLVKVHSFDNLITDSAASATAFSSGIKTTITPSTIYK